MSWQTAIAQTYSNCADFLENGTIGLHDKMVDAGWTLHDNLNATSGQTDKVFKSTGEDASETIFIRITQVSGGQRIRFGAYTFWDASGHAGHNEIRGGLSYNSTTEWPHCCDTMSTNFIGWIAANKDGVGFIHKLSGTRYSAAYFGLIKTRQVPTCQSGRTTLSSGVTIAASGSTVLSVGSETNIATGQRIWVINQNTTAGGTMVRCTVTGTASGQITVTNDSGVATTFDTGALVGYDPQPIILPTALWDGTYARALPQKQYTTLYKMSDTRKTGTAQTYTAHARLQSFNPLYNIVGGQTWPPNGADYDNNQNMRSRSDPDLFSRFVLFPYTFLDGYTDSTSPVTEGVIRGSVDRVCLVCKGTTLANEDTISIAGSTVQWIAMDTGTPNFADSADNLFSAVKLSE